MSQFCHHMCPHGHVCGRVWRHLGPRFLPPLPPPLRLFQLFQSLYHIGVFWSILDHLEATLAKYGAHLAPFYPILANFGPIGDVLGIKIHIFWTRLMRIWHFGICRSIVPLMFRNMSNNTQTTRTLSFNILPKSSIGRSKWNHGSYKCSNLINFGLVYGFESGPDLVSF